MERKEKEKKRKGNTKKLKQPKPSRSLGYIVIIADQVSKKRHS